MLNSKIHKGGMHMICNKCGKEITDDSKFCEYCGSGVEPVNIKVWSLQNFCEVDYNHC